MNTPWKIENSDDGIRIFDSGGKLIVSPTLGICGKHDIENAALIIRAVNNYEGLLTALNDLYKAPFTCFYAAGSHEHQQCTQAMEKARKALANAGGE